MTGTSCLAVTLVVLLVTSSVTAEPPPPGPLLLRGELSPALTATVVSVRSISGNTASIHRKTGKAPLPGTGSVATEPSVTGGSGLARHGAWMFVAQDDSSNLAVIARDGRIERLRLFDAVDGRDRFHPAFGNKNAKPDVEAIVRVDVSAAVVRRLGGQPGRARTVPVILVFGSGSIRGVRDRVAIVVPREPLSTSVVRAVTATGLYDRLRATPELTGSRGEINVEAAAAVDGTAAVRLYNRGNSGPGSITSSVDVSTRDLLDYLVAANTDTVAPFTAALGNPCHYDLGASGDYAVTIGEAIALPTRPELGGSGAILIAGIAEATTNAIDDGKTSGTAIGLHLAGSQKLLFTPVKQDRALASLKIEGLAVLSTRTAGRGRSRRLVMRVLGVVDSDSADPLAPSELVELEVTYAQPQSHKR